MLKKNLFQKLTSAVLVMCFCICSVGSVCLAKYPDEKGSPNNLKKQASINIPPPSANLKEYKLEYDILKNDKRTEYEYDCEEEEEEEEEWNEQTTKVDGKVGNNVSTNEKEDDNLGNNNHSAKC